MSLALVIVLAIAVVLGVARLVLRWRRSAPEMRAARWRMAVLIAMQPVCATLLYLTLLPADARSTDTLVVVTRHGRTDLSDNRIVALPEAAAAAGAERVPDLATALRRYRPARIRVVGDGLEPRDIDAAPGVPVDFAPAPAPSGLVRIDDPTPVAAGAVFRVGGRVAGLAKAQVDLLDPAGRRVDTAIPDTTGDFVVSATARAPGSARFTLRVRAGSRVVETATIPEVTVSTPPQRVLLLAGAPGPEVKYLRRWATAAGMVVHSRFATGGGLELGDAPSTLSAATLRDVDLLVVDERSWAALGPGERAATVAAIRAGLGVLVRIDGALTDPERVALRPLGFAVANGAGAIPFSVPASPVDAAGRTAREGPGTVDAPSALNRDAAVPALTRWPARISASMASPLVRDAKGSMIVSWRAEGLGRVALWPLDDSFRLVLTGADESYDALWRNAFATLGRGIARPTPWIDQPAWVGQRVAVCGAVPGTIVVGPDGGLTRLVDDPVAGCAGFWPRTTGDHALRRRGDRAGSPFTVLAAGALPNVRAQTSRDATLALAAGSRAGIRATTLPSPVGGAWLWAVAWLAASGGLWWFERSRIGQPGR